MPKQKICRKINYEFPFILYKPAWICQKNLEIIDLQEDELEAIRLVYLENLNMKQWAEKMQVSAPTFNRILNSGLKK